MPLEPLWSVQGKRSVVKCVLQVEETWAELLLLQDDNVASRELFQSDDQARLKAGWLRTRLLDSGWKTG